MLILGFFNNINSKIESKMEKHIPLNNSIIYILLIIYYIFNINTKSFSKIYTTNNIVLYIVVVICRYVYKYEYSQLKQNNNHP